MNSNGIKKIFSKVMPHGDVLSYKDMSKGHVNDVYLVEVFNKRDMLKEDFVLRVFPKDGWKAVKEKYLYRHIRNTVRVDVPEVILADTTKKLIRKDYIILRKIEGEEMGARKDIRLIRQSGTLLARLHSIKFNKFGWIVGKKIEPKFSKWVDFLEFDLDQKLSKLHKVLTKKALADIRDYFDSNKKVLDIETIPCLLHKDYSYAHIIVGKKINGIIDIEWAIAGHNELDIVKSLLWMFKDDKRREKAFLNGYRKEGSISKDFAKRRTIYEMLVFVNSIAFSTECGSKQWCSYNIKELKRILYG